MKMNRRQAFTLPELLIGMLLILIVLGGVVATLKSGLDVYSGSEANGKVTTGVRFTVASFKSEILPMVNAASNIEILKDAGSIPSAISGSGDYYIYRSTDSTVKCRSAAGDISLNGSEYISSLDFSVPKSSADKLENYLLNMHIEGQDPKYQTAYVSIDVAMALVGRPEKSATSSASGSNYAGGVLHFSAFSFANLKIRDASEDYKVLTDSQSVAKGDALQVHYDISVPAGKKDVTKMLWYARTELNTNVAADKDKSIGYHESAKYASVSYSDTTARDYWWPLLIKSNDKYYLASELYKSIDVVTGNNFLEIPTSNDKFYVYTGQGGGAKDLTDMGDFDANGVLTDASKAQPMSEYCFLRAWVVPSYSDSDGTNTRYPSGYAQWSTRVNIRETGVAGQKFFTDWMLAVQASNNGTSTSDQLANHWQNSTGETATATITASKTVINGPGGSNLIQYAKIISPDYLNDARRYDMAVNNGVSYTSPANYSIIIDAKAGISTAGIGLLLNGYRSNGRTSGYVFYYDPGANGFPIRLQYTDSAQTGGNIVNGYKAYGANEIESPLQADIVNSIKASDITNRTDGDFYGHYYNPQYVPAALQNNIYNNAVESSTTTLRGTIGDYTDECHELQKRHRYMLTILEYYTTSGGMQYPMLLVRMRLLRPLNDVKSGSTVIEKGATTLYNMTEKQLRKEDPFLMGPKFYYSEAAWYGVFVGQTPKFEYTSTVLDTMRDRGTTYKWYEYDWHYKFKILRSGVDTSFDRSIYTVRDQYWRTSPNPPELTDSFKSSVYKSDNIYYATQSPVKSSNSVARYSDGYSKTVNSIIKYFNGGVYKGVTLDPRGALEADNSSYATADRLGKLTPDRNHWIGIALWGGNTSGSNSSIVINSMTLVPGFDESELRSIMSNGAKVFGIDDTKGSYDTTNAQYSETTDTGVAWNKTLFGGNGYSDGSGNISQNNLYKNRFTNASGTKEPCVMSLQHTGTKSDGSDCDCPMCRRYKTYLTNPITFW